MRSSVRVSDGIVFGPGEFPVMAGPCAVEDRTQVLTAARAVAAAGAAVLRGGAFKPRTSPRSFQGLGAAGLDLLREAGASVGLPIITEVLDPRDVELVAGCAAILQVGSRNMQNAPLLREAGRSGLPVLLKRGAAASLHEMLAAAEYVSAEGNERILLCERGIRGFDTTTRYTLDLAAIPVLQELSPYPVIIDPSHGTGHARFVAPMARAALAAGADGLLIEVHPHPESALSDGQQALRPEEFAALMNDLRRAAPLMGRAVADASSDTSSDTTPEAPAEASAS